MGLNYTHSNTVRKFAEMLNETMDEDLSERADRVLAQAQTKNFGFQDQSGNLRKSIKKVKIANKRIPGYRIQAGEGALADNGNSYALAVELGHPKRGMATKLKRRGTPKDSSSSVAARPFLRPSLRAGRD